MKKRNAHDYNGGYFNLIPKGLQKPFSIWLYRVGRIPQSEFQYSIDLGPIMSIRSFFHLLVYR